METSSVKTALLTIGGGALSVQAFATLREMSNLRGVVFSQRKKKGSKLKRVVEYGAWYTMQQLGSQLYNLQRGNKLSPEQDAASAVESRIWRSSKSAKPVGDWLEAEEVELVVVSGFQFILRASFFNRVPYCFNIHPSYLPAYKGPEPIAWGVLDRQKQFGVTLHEVDEGIDTGAIFAQTAVSRPRWPLFAHVEQQLANQLPPLLQRLLEAVHAKQVQTNPQLNEGFYLAAPTLAARRERADRPTATQTQ